MSNYDEKIDLFVPGRLCIIGEHSDWAGMNRMMNSSITPGYAVVTGIEQGIYATVSKSDKFIVESDIDDLKNEYFECEMDTDKLRRIASEGGFFAYVAGVASYMNEHYRIGGIRVHITKRDLVIKSGLSSSAAICVLIARAFNQLYHLQLNTAGEMNIAYWGEQRTPSRCGRLDQACAYGVNPVLMKFDGNDINVSPLAVRAEMRWVVTNLNARKDTIKILADLNSCYPFAKSEIEEHVHEALGPDNKIFVKKAVEFIESGETEQLGKLMMEFQKNFDKKVAPACPEELTAPVLHSVLNDVNIRKWIYGCKGIGSQGDGTVQFLAKDEKSQKELIKYLKNEKGMDSVSFTLHPQQKIKKAVIPVAGFGTRLFPTTKNLKKSFFPIMDRDGVLKPVLLILLEQLYQAGIEDICLVIGDGEKEIYEEFFNELPEEYYEKLTDDKKRYENFIKKIGRKITYVIQTERKGFGHAVYMCKNFANNEPILLLLGDMIYQSSVNDNCMKQMINAYEKYGMPVISMHKINKEDVIHYGVMHGQWDDDIEQVLKLDQIKEKPTVQYAEDELKVVTKDNNENYYAVFGQYVLTKEVFDVLGERVKKNELEDGEIQLTSALEETRKITGMIGYKILGKSYDIGLPDKYYDTMVKYCKDEKL